MTLSIDDFGTGFSSLATLYRLPFNELKIDKCFTVELDRSSAARALIESTVEMAQRLGLSVTAEGVETETVFEQLKRIGCHDAQGYFISKSLAASEIPPFFGRWRESRTVAGGAPGFVSKLAAIQALIEQAFAPAMPDRTVVLASSETCGMPLLAEVAALPALVLQGRQLPALAACHGAARSLKSSPEQAALRTQIVELQQLLESELLVHGDIALVAADREFRLLPRRSALIGRCSDEMAVDVAIDCHWLSRADRGLFLRCGADGWSLEDLGSRNGVTVNEAPLVPETPFVLSPGETTLHIGGRNHRRAPLSVHLRQLSDPNASAIALRVSASGDTEAATWPTRARDLLTTWVVFAGPLSIGEDTSCAIRLPEANNVVLANIEFQNGFWISPRNNEPLFLDGIAFHHPVPLVAGATLRLGEAEFRIEQSSRAATPEEFFAGETSPQRHASRGSR